MIIGFIVVAILSGLPNNIAGIFGGRLYTQPAWLPLIAFPWWICFGSIVTFCVGLLFRDQSRASVATASGSLPARWLGRVCNLMQAAQKRIRVAKVGEHTNCTLSGKPAAQTRSTLCLFIRRECLDMFMHRLRRD